MSGAQRGGLAGLDAARHGVVGDHPDDSVVRDLVRLFGAARARTLGRDGIQCALADLIDRIDRLVAEQVGVVIHHERFRALEANWRGVRYLVDSVASWRVRSRAGGRRTVGSDLLGPSAEEAPEQLRPRPEQRRAGRVDIEVLDVRKDELARDMARGVEDSDLFDKVYNQAFGTPGAVPFGLTVGAFSFGGAPSDVALLRDVAGVAAAAFCPFITSPAPDLFGLTSFGDLEYRTDLRELTAGIPGWSALREADDSRFVGLVMPRVLARTPHRGPVARSDLLRCGNPRCGAPVPALRPGARCGACGHALGSASVVDETLAFAFCEQVGRDGEELVWMSGAFAFAGVAARAFVETGWFSDVVGLDPAPRSDALHEGGGLVTGLPIDDFGTDAWGVVRKPPVEVVLDDAVERRLAALGFVPIVPCRHSEFVAFLRAPSAQAIPAYDRSIATANAVLSASLPVVMCAARFAHYLKVRARDSVGSHVSARELESDLNGKLSEFVHDRHLANAEDRARFPLRRARVAVTPSLREPGRFDCTIHLVPQSRLEQLEVALDLTTHMTAIGRDA